MSRLQECISSSRPQTSGKMLTLTQNVLLAFFFSPPSKRYKSQCLVFENWSIGFVFDIWRCFFWPKVRCSFQINMDAQLATVWLWTHLQNLSLYALKGKQRGPIRLPLAVFLPAATTERFQTLIRIKYLRVRCVWVVGKGGGIVMGVVIFFSWECQAERCMVLGTRCSRLKF